MIPFPSGAGLVVPGSRQAKCDLQSFVNPRHERAGEATDDMIDPIFAQRRNIDAGDNRVVQQARLSPIGRREVDQQMCRSVARDVVI